MRHEFVVSHTDVRAWHEPAKLRFTTRGPRWLRRWTEKAMRWALRVTGAEIERSKTMRTFRTASGDTLLDRMKLNMDDMRRLYDQRARYVFIGPDVEPELLDCARMMWLGPLDARIGGPNGIKQIYGVEIVFVPWMRGALLVPEIESRIARQEAP